MAFLNITLPSEYTQEFFEPVALRVVGCHVPYPLKSFRPQDMNEPGVKPTLQVSGESYGDVASEFSVERYSVSYAAHLFLVDIDFQSIINAQPSLDQDQHRSGKMLQPLIRQQLQRHYLRILATQRHGALILGMSSRHPPCHRQLL